MPATNSRIATTITHSSSVNSLFSFLISAPIYLRTRRTGQSFRSKFLAISSGRGLGRGAAIYKKSSQLHAWLGIKAGGKLFSHRHLGQKMSLEQSQNVSRKIYPQKVRVN